MINQIGYDRVALVNAHELSGNDRTANMVMLGAYIEATKTVNVESIYEAFTKVFGEHRAHLLPINKEALEKGAESIRKQMALA